MDRYKRHYAMSDGEVLAYLSSLKLARITKAGTYHVYSVPPGGAIKLSVRNFRAGTPVFADAHGNPVMILKCGNPLDRGPNRPGVHRDPNPDLEAKVTELRESELPDEELIELDELMTYTPEFPHLNDLPEEIITINDSPIPFIIPAGTFGGGWLLGLIGAGLIIGGGGDGGGDTVIPEPASLAVLAVGASGLILRRARRRQR